MAANSTMYQNQDAVNDGLYYNSTRNDPYIEEYDTILQHTNFEYGIGKEKER